MSLKLVNSPPSYCSRNHQSEYVLEWTPEKHYVAGTRLELRCNCLRSFIFWDWMHAEMEQADISWRWEPYPRISDYRSNWNRVVFRARMANGIRRGETRRIRLRLVPSIFAGVNAGLSVWVLDQKLREASEEPEAVPEEGSTCVLEAQAGPVGRLRVLSRPFAGPDDTVRTCIVPEDQFGNPTSFQKDVPVRLTWRGEERELNLRETTVIDLPASAEVERARLAVPMTTLQTGENIANGRRESGDLVIDGNPVWAEQVGGCRPAFGEFHWHTEFSADGDRPIEEAIRAAREFINLDFLAPGDHTPKGEKWDATVAAMDEADDPGRFATFYGYEQSSPRGHVNVYFLDPDHPLKPGCWTLRGYPEDFLPYLEGDDFIIIPHHTNALAETRDEEGVPFWHQFPWPEPLECMPLAEIIQVRGNQERNEYSDRWHGWHQHNGASLQDALAAGHRIGFTGGTDNHSGWPARAYAPSENFMGADNDPHTQIMTGVWTPDVEREAIFEQLQNRATWVVRDTRAIVDFRVNGTLMGGECSVSAGDELRATIRLSAEDTLQVVEIVSETETVWSDSADDLDVDLTVDLGPVTGSTHFYLRALQRDGGLIYASPVFVDVE